MDAKTVLSKVFYRLFILLFVRSYQTECANSSTHFRLYSDLMESYNSPYIRPITDDEHAVSVGFRFAPIITLLDESNQKLESRGMLLLTWFDNRLTWNPGDYGDINETNVPLYKDGAKEPHIWRPELVLYESRESFESIETETTVVSLSFTGEINWYTLASTKSHCVVDVRYYPFDTQICDLSFTTWVYQTDEQIFYSVTDVLEDASYKMFEVNNGLWDVRVNHIHIGNASFRCKTCAGQEQSYVHYTLELKRGEHWLYFYNLLFPCFVMSGMSVLVIWLPTKDVSGAASLGLTCVLAFFVYMAFLFSELPATGLSIIGNYIVWLIAEGVIITFYSVHRANQKKHEQNKSSFIVSEENGKDKSTWTVTQLSGANKNEKENASLTLWNGSEQNSADASKEFGSQEMKVSYQPNTEKEKVVIAGAVSAVSTTDGNEQDGEHSEGLDSSREIEMQDTEEPIAEEGKERLVPNGYSKCHIRNINIDNIKANYPKYLTLKIGMIGIKVISTVVFVVILFLYIGQ
ncbi:Neuronal acetylcholine receptor subunit alpha-9 [Holothuria leucospilota]|uniref:Neuronal acetylcholine receptor subunit alpha-9 n=1 Tax=Holothuria leucospilota TaxID=206669 RepID=A0A9Q1HJV8_HOLLE|nr:Neuronal acetylcholine receptor subunit alpha-9 [Holothuria leucospilota]